MDRTACKKPQCLYKVALYLYFIYLNIQHRLQAKCLICHYHVQWGQLRNMIRH